MAGCLQSLVGFLGMGMIGVTAIAAPDFLQMLLNASSLALAPAVASLLMNLLEFLSSLDINRPELRA